MFIEDSGSYSGCFSPIQVFILWILGSPQLVSPPEGHHPLTDEQAEAKLHEHDYASQVRNQLKYARCLDSTLKKELAACEANIKRSSERPTRLSRFDDQERASLEKTRDLLRAQHGSAVELIGLLDRTIRLFMMFPNYLTPQLRAELIANVKKLHSWSHGGPSASDVQESGTEVEE